MRPAFFMLLTLVFVNSNAHSTSLRVDKLFRDTQYKQFKISPRGDLIAAWTTQANKHQILVFKPTEEKTYTAFEEFQNIRKLSSTITHLEWIDEDSLFINHLRTGGDIRTTIIDISKNSDGTLTLENNEILARGYLVDPLPEEKDKVLFAVEQEEKKRFNVFKLDLRDVDWTSVFKGIGRLNGNIKRGYLYFTDHKHRLRIAIQVMRKHFNYMYRDLKDNQWRPFHKVEKTLDTFKPVGFIDDETIAVISNIDRDKTAVLEYDMNKRKMGKVLFESPLYDVSGASIDPQTSKLKSVALLVNGKPTIRYFAADQRALDDKLKKAFPDKLSLVYDASKDRKKLVILALSPSHPGTFYYLNADTLKARPLAEANPELIDAPVLPSHPIKVKSKDGLPIEGLLTLPNTSEEPFPLVVMPHGGPIGVRVYDLFDPRVQFLADRGFAVLRINFRGSSGYGKSFQEKGVGQWGKGIEEDINSCVDHTISNYSIDADKLCILGTSYGGYSALMSVIRFPGKYKCAVSSFGVTDVNLIFHQTNTAETEKVQKTLTRIIGDPIKHKINLKSISPFYEAEKIDVPLLLLAGRFDRVADFEQTHRLKVALDLLKKPCKYLIYNSAGHGHKEWVGDWHQWIMIEDFLRKEMNIGYPISEPANTIYGFESRVVGEEYYNGNIVEKDLEQSSFWLNRSIDLGDIKAGDILLKVRQESQETPDN